MSTPEFEAKASFSVRAAAEPQAMPRLLELFALRSLVPSRWRAETLGAELHVHIEVAELDRAAAEHLAARMRQMVAVHKVLLGAPRLARSA